MGTLATYKPLYVWCSPASIPQIVAHIQDYLVKNPIVSTETVAEIVVQSLQEHPELINGAVIPITEDSAQTIKEYIDALPSLDGYTKAETDALLLLKQNLLTWDQTPTVGSSNPVTSKGIKAAISASAAALADLISTKADIASVYTKATTDALLLQKADAATTYSKNAVDALLDTKVDINDTYTKADIDLMKQVDKANTAIVTDGTAPFNIAAGQYVYVNDILYMATEPITENDPLIPGTNIALTPKGVTNVLGDGLQNLAHTVGEQSDQIAKLNTSLKKWDVNTNGKIIFIGNSYTKWDAENWLKFPDRVAEYLDLGQEGINWWNCGVPSANLSSDTIQNQLYNWVTNNPAEVNKIGAVVLVAGLNDSDSTNYLNVPGKLQNLANYILTNLPNAKPMCGYVGWLNERIASSDSRAGVYRASVLQSYIDSTAYGWVYLSGIENVIHDKNLIASDGIHPNEDGAKAIGRAVTNALICGTAETYKQNYISTNEITPLQNASVDAGSIKQTQCDGIVETFIDAVQLSYNTAVTLSAGSDVALFNVNCRFTNIVDFGHCIAIVTDDNYTNVMMLFRGYISKDGNFNIQIRGFTDNSISKNTIRINAFYANTSTVIKDN